MKNRKNKKKLFALIPILILLDLTISFFIANFLDITARSIKEKENIIVLLKSNRYSVNNFFTNFTTSPVVIKMFVAVLITLLPLTFYLFFLSSKKSQYAYEIKLTKITDKLEIPLPSGQFQHGSAWFVEKKDFKKNFTYVKLPSKELLKQKSKKNKLINGEVFLDFLYDERRLPEGVDGKIINSGGLVLGRELNKMKLSFDKKKFTETIFYVNDDTHSLVIGSTRSGKTRGLVLQTIGLQALAGENMITSDPKGELFYFTNEFLKKLDYEVITIDFSTTQSSNKYNYLQPIIDMVNANEINKAIEVTADITNSLVGRQVGEPIWHDGQCSVIAFAILAVVIENKNRPMYQNLTNVYFFISEMCRPDPTNNGQLYIQKYFDVLCQDNPTHPALVEAKISEIAPSKTRGSFFTSALTTLRLFANPNIYSMSNKTDFVMQDVKRKRAIFIILPDEKTTYYKIASLFVNSYYVSCVQQAKQEGNRLPIRLNMNLDEFGNFSVIPDFTAKITVGGGYGIRFNLFIQSFKQLDAVYDEKDSITIQDNCDTLVYLKANLSETRQAISDRLGKYTVTVTSDSTSVSGGSVKDKGGGSYSSSTSLIERQLLTADEIGKIERPYILVITSSQKAIFTAPDLTQYGFNELYGLGDKEHNRRVIEARQKNRPIYKVEEIRLWGIWEAFVKRRTVTEEEPKID